MWWSLVGRQSATTVFVVIQNDVLIVQNVFQLHVQVVLSAHLANTSTRMILELDPKNVR